MTWFKDFTKYANKCPKSYTKNGGPAPRPFSAISKEPELTLRNLLFQKYLLREREDGGAAGPDLPSAFDCGNTYSTRCLVIALAYRHSSSFL